MGAGSGDAPQSDGTGSKKPGWAPPPEPPAGSVPVVVLDPKTTKYVNFPRPMSDVFVNTSSLAGVASASNLASSTYNREISASDAELLWDDNSVLSDQDRKFITELAKARGGRSGSALWERAVAIAEKSKRDGNPLTPIDVINQMASGLGVDELSGGGSGSGRGGYSGPTSSTTFMDERDVDRTANALALELIGRPLSQKELSKVTKRLRSEEAANPTISTPGVGSSVTQSGLSAEGRADVLREVISENPEFQQYQVDHTVLDAMLAGLNKREQMVNGG